LHLRDGCDEVLDQEGIEYSKWMPFEKPLWLPRAM
jgi:hypothetical protein